MVERRASIDDHRAVATAFAVAVGRRIYTNQEEACSCCFVPPVLPCAAWRFSFIHSKTWVGRHCCYLVLRIPDLILARGRWDL